MQNRIYRLSLLDRIFELSELIVNVTKYSASQHIKSEAEGEMIAKQWLFNENFLDEHPNERKVW